MNDAQTQIPATTPDQARNYMHNEIIWARLIVLAWQNADVMKQLQAASQEPTAQNYINNVLTNLAKNHFDMDPVFPPGTTMKVVFDTDTVKNLLLPFMPNIPPGPLMMVPHGL